MLDGSTQIICWDSNLFSLTDNAVTGNTNNFKIVGRDRGGQTFPTKVIQKISLSNATDWWQIQANSVTLICSHDQQIFTTAGWKQASNITDSDFVYGLSGTNRYSFTAGGAASHITIANQYIALFISFAVTSSSSYVQTADAFGLKCSTGQFFANRFLVHGE